MIVFIFLVSYWCVSLRLIASDTKTLWHIVQVVKSFCAYLFIYFSAPLIAEPSAPRGTRGKPPAAHQRAMTPRSRLE